MPVPCIELSVVSLDMQEFCYHYLMLLIIHVVLYFCIGKQKHEDEEMVVPGNEGGSDMKNTCNSNQTSIPDCETQKQEIAPKEGDKRYCKKIHTKPSAMFVFM